MYNVKAKRQRLAIINTDHKILMAEIEKTLHLLHSELPVFNATSSALGNDEKKESNKSVNMLKAFAIIDDILAASPAQEAGLVDGE